MRHDETLSRLPYALASQVKSRRLTWIHSDFEHAFHYSDFARGFKVVICGSPDWKFTLFYWDHHFAKLLNPSEPIPFSWHQAPGMLQVPSRRTCGTARGSWRWPKRRTSEIGCCRPWWGPFGSNWKYQATFLPQSWLFFFGDDKCRHTVSLCIGLHWIMRNTWVDDEQCKMMNDEWWCMMMMMICLGPNHLRKQLPMRSYIWCILATCYNHCLVALRGFLPIDSRWQHVRPRSMRPTGDPEPQSIPMTHTSLTDMVHSLDEYPKMKSIEKLYVYQAILVYLLNRSGPNSISRDHRAMIHTRFLSHT